MPLKCSVRNQERFISSPVVVGTAVSPSCAPSVRGQPATGIIVHNIAEQKHVHQIQGAHKGKVSGLCFADNDRLLSCGVDCNIKLWDASPREQTSVSILASFISFTHPIDVPSSNKNRSTCFPENHLSSIDFRRPTRLSHSCHSI